jgi:hypothetical protein
MFGGQLSGAGIRRVSSLAYLTGDSWCDRTPVMPWNGDEDVGFPNDFAEYHGRDEVHSYALIGKAKSGMFSLTLERWDKEEVTTTTLDCKDSDRTIIAAIRRALQSNVTVKIPKRNEQHAYTLTGEATGGTMTLTIEKSDHTMPTTTAWAWNASDDTIRSAIQTALDETVTVEIERVGEDNAVGTIAIHYDAGDYARRIWKTGTLDYSGLTGVTGYEVEATAEPLTSLRIVFDHRLYMGRSWTLGTLDYSELVGVTGCTIARDVVATGGEIHRYRFDKVPTAGTFILHLIDDDGDEGDTAAIDYDDGEAAVQSAVDAVMGSGQTRVELTTDGGAITEVAIHLSGTNYAHKSWAMGSVDVSELVGVAYAMSVRDIWSFHFLAGTHTLDDGASIRQFAFAYRTDWDSGYTGFDIEDGLEGGMGTCLRVYGDKLYLGQLGVGGPGVAVTDLRRASWNDHTGAWTKEGIGWAAEIGGTNPIPRDMLVVERNGSEELVVVGEFGDDADYHCIAFYNSATDGYFDPGGCGTGQGAQLWGACLHDFEDGRDPRLVVCGKYATIGGGSLTTSPNVSGYDVDADEWLACAAGVSLEGYTFCAAVESFNHRLWTCRGFDPVGPSPSSVNSLLALPNGPAPAWVPAVSIIKDMDYDANGVTSGFWRYAWTGDDSEPEDAPIVSLCRYGNRMLIGGGQQFRTLRRGRDYSGPVVGFDAGDNLYRGLREFLRGEVYAECFFDGGLAVAGKFVVQLADGRVLRNVAVWHEPATWGDPGTWDDLNGGLDGPVHALAVFDGKLHAGGAFHHDGAGVVELKGLAWWNATSETWTYTANFSDYGKVSCLCVAGSSLIVGGDFQKADGQSRYGSVCAWSGSALSAIYASIDSADRLPIVRAVCLYDGYLYAGGAFNNVDGFACYAVARRTWPSYSVWGPLNNTGGTPPNGILTPGTVWSLCSHGSRIYVGTEPGSKPNGESTTGAIWTWNPASPDWAPALPSQYPYGDTPCMAMFSDGTNIYLGTDAYVQTMGNIEAWGKKFRVYKQTTPGGTPTALGGTSGYFEDAILAVVVGDAGGGDRPFVGGRFQSVGAIISAASKTCNLVTSLGEDDRIHDVRGGLGVGAYMAHLTSAQWVQRIRTFRSETVACERAAIAGVFFVANEVGTQHLFGLDRRGQVVGVAGGLAGSNRYNSTGAPDGVNDIKAIPRDEWPAWWETMLTERECEPYIAWAFLIGGSFSVAINDDRALDDQANIPETFETAGIVLHYGRHFRKITPGAGLPGYCMSVAVYVGDLIHLGMDTPPAKLIYPDADPENAYWEWLIDPGTPGGLVVGLGGHTLVWQGRLWVAGVLWINPYFSGSDPCAAVADWDGENFTLHTVIGLGDATAQKPGNYLLVADLDDGQGECLFLAAQPSDPTTKCPVYRKTIGGGWSAVGGAGQLRGTAQALSVVLNDAGCLLVCQGALKVYVGGVWVECAVAGWDGSAWVVLAHVGSTDVPQYRAVSDTWGREGDDQSRSRAYVVGRVGEFADDADDIGSADSTPAHGSIAVDSGGGLSVGPGCNGELKAGDTATRLLFAAGGG